MASLSGLLQRPFAAMTATVAAALYAEVPDKLHKRSAPTLQDSGQPSLQIQSSPPVHETSSLSHCTTRAVKSGRLPEKYYIRQSKLQDVYVDGLSRPLNRNFRSHG